MKKIALIAATLLAAGVAQAQTATPFYGEVGFNFGKVKTSGLTADPFQVKGIVGYDVLPYLSVEGMVGTTGEDDSSNDVKVRINNTYGVYVKPHYKMSDKMSMFVRLGYVETKMSLSAQDAKSSGKDHDVSWGLGLTYNFDKQLYSSIDYTSLYNKDSTKISGVTVSFGAHF